ncbi:MAG: hypothetical protein ACTS4X_01880 [Candidatus Hodgkinia cicadicola]
MNGIRRVLRCGECGTNERTGRGRTNGGGRTNEVNVAEVSVVERRLRSGESAWSAEDPKVEC